MLVARWGVMLTIKTKQLFPVEMSGTVNIDILFIFILACDRLNIKKQQLVSWGIYGTLEEPLVSLATVSDS